MTIVKNLIDWVLLSVSRLIPERLAQHWLFLLRHNTDITDRWRYHIRPIHYYEPLPDFQHILPGQLIRPREYPGIDFKLLEQIDLLQRLGRLYKSELVAIAGSTANGGFDFHNPYFAGLDAALYYSLIRDLKPARVIEIGSGYSTRIAARALRQNHEEGQYGKLICIEPYPQPRLTNANLQIDLIQTRVQDVDLSFFSQLQANDILFIDSSHSVSFGSDVGYEFLELLPRINKGVWVHVHDIFFPHDYPAEWLIDQRIAFNEQYLLEAFLSFNSTFSVKAASYWLLKEGIEHVSLICPSDLLPNGPLGKGSFWMRRDC